MTPEHPQPPRPTGTSILATMLALLIALLIVAAWYGAFAWLLVWLVCLVCHTELHWEYAMALGTLLFLLGARIRINLRT